MKSKKILAVLMAAGMTLSLAACGSSSDSTDKSADNGSDSGKTYKIGILQQLEHAALDEATKGFEDACTEKFGEGNVKFDLQNGQGEQANCATIANNFVADNVDLILANATTAITGMSEQINTGANDIYKELFETQSNPIRVKLAELEKSSFDQLSNLILQLDPEGMKILLQQIQNTIPTNDNSATYMMQILDTVRRL